MRRAAVAVAVLAAVGVVAAAPGGAKGDRARLQGTWEVLSVTAGGKDVTPKTGRRMLLTFQADRISSRLGDGQEEASTYTLDETKKPAHLTVAKTARQGEMKAVYQLDGDTLRIAFSPKGPDGERPDAVAAKDAVLLTLKRARK
jgi:uncharacterized protein (TIGR03067 family)